MADWYILRSIFLTFISFISMGITCLVLLYLRKSTKSIPNYQTFFTILAIISIVFLILSLYLSFRTTKIAKRTLLSMFIIFDIFLIGITITIFIIPQKLISEIKFTWDLNNKPNTTNGIEEVFHCSGRNETIPPSTLKPCLEVVDSLISNYGLIILILCLFHTFATIFTIYLRVDSGGSDDGIKSKDNYNTPLTFGW